MKKSKKYKNKKLTKRTNDEIKAHHLHVLN